MPASLCFAGRAHDGSTVDVSRSGVALHCDLVPSVGSDVRLTIDVDEPIDARGTVVRVDIREDGTATVGIELTRMSEASEAALVALVADLAA